MVFQREYGRNIDFSMNESSVDKNIVPEYSELLNVDETSKTSFNNNNSNISVNNNNISNSNITATNTTINTNTSITTTISTTNNGNPAQFGDVEMTSVEISTKPAVLPNSPSIKSITEQTETRRADGKRRITAKFVPFSMEQDG